MKVGTYSLLTLRPDLERIDLLAVGVVALAEGEWRVYTLPSPEKLHAIDENYPQKRLTGMALNLTQLFSDECSTLEEARALLQQHRSSASMHAFEGQFSYDTEQDFQRQVQAIMNESVLPMSAEVQAVADIPRQGRQRLRARLRRQFEHMGILGKGTSDIDSHKVVRNFPISIKHGLVAEFALKNSAMHLTETVDFEVVEEGMREKIFEAQAKCLVMRAAIDNFGKATQCHFVIAGGGGVRVARSVDLLSSAGTLYSLESSVDMENYFDAMARAAYSPRQLRPPN